MRLLALALAALVLAGCETTAEKSARLERAAKRHAVNVASPDHAPFRRSPPATPAPTFGALERRSCTAAKGRPRSSCSTTRAAEDLHEVPVLITVKDAGGHTLYTNNAPGLSHALTGVALLPAHGTLTWIDDQLQAAGTPAAVTAKVGDGTTGQRHAGACSPSPVR